MAEAAPATRILLVRHGATDAVGRSLAGRTPGVHLNRDGVSQASALGQRFAALRLAAVLSGPLERARETAAAIAAPHGLQPRTLADLDEADFGEWTGRTFAELAADSRWTAYNAHRSRAVVPGGEAPRAVQARIVRMIHRARVEYAGATIAAVSHAEVIRAAVLHCAGMPLDAWSQCEIAPASVTEIVAGGDGVLRLAPAAIACRA